MSAEQAGFNEGLIRQEGVASVQYDQASIDGLISVGAIGDRYIKNLTADKITAGTITASINVGVGRAAVMNGTDGRFEVWDGETMVGFQGFMTNRFAT